MKPPRSITHVTAMRLARPDPSGWLFDLDIDIDVAIVERSTPLIEPSST